MFQRVSATLGVGTAFRRSMNRVVPASRAPSASRRPAVRSSKGNLPQLSTITAADPAQRIASFAQASSILRSEEHTSELQSLMRISYAVFCLKKKKHQVHKATNKYK